jgi:carbonic anhydrase
VLFTEFIHSVVVVVGHTGCECVKKALTEVAPPADDSTSNPLAFLAHSLQYPVNASEAQKMEMLACANVSTQVQAIQTFLSGLSPLDIPVTLTGWIYDDFTGRLRDISSQE